MARRKDPIASGRQGTKPSTSGVASRSARGTRAAIGASLLVVLVAVAWSVWRPAPPAEAPRPAARSPQPARFVGSDRCGGCHASAEQGWRKSQHALAMQPATDATVLGDFAGAKFRHAGIESTFLRRDGKFFVQTDGADGRIAEFEIAYAFGVHPLQQYLIPFPDGRLQALSIAWDARAREQGGQRWFHLHPDETIPHDDELHWTKRAQNWNDMCADCHSTDVRKRYDADADRYSTRWSEISVGCEACHGPASNHLAWAKGERPEDEPGKGLTVVLDERRGVHWQRNPETGRLARSRPRNSDAEIEVCAPCHSRRGQFAEGHVAGRPFLDHYRPALLEPGLHHVDGQQRDEVYTWGSFLQSRMYRSGVTCSDCHDPHTQQLRATGNALCTQCHEAASYDDRSHHFHPERSEGADCVACHMPATSYMVIDPRHDHSLRVPRPDESVRLGVPNACNRCHLDRDERWAAEAVRGWLGRDARGFQTFAETFHAAASGGIRAAASLAQQAIEADQPEIARATALGWLATHPSREGIEAAQRSLGDASPIVRLAALDALAVLAPEDRAALASRSLADPIRAVRIAAARLLAPAAGRLDPAARRDFERAAEELVAAERHRADRPEHRTNLATFFTEQGRFDEAAKEFAAAIEMEPRFVPAYVNLADMLRRRDDEPAGIEVLQAGLKVAPEAASLHHALGLALVRRGEPDRAVAELERAAALEPSSARYAHVHAVALHSSGDATRAIRALEDALEVHPHDRDLLTALAAFQRDVGDRPAALRAAERLEQAFPGDPAARALRAELGGAQGR